MPRPARLSARASIAGLAVAALCAQQLIVASGASADSVTVTDYPGLVAAFANGGTVVLGANLTSYDQNTGYQVGPPLVVGDGTAVTLDLNGHFLDLGYGDGVHASIGVPDTSGTSLTIDDHTGTMADGWAGMLWAQSSGAAAIGGDHNHSGGKVTIAGGNIYLTTDGSAGIGSGSVDDGSTDVDGGSLTVTGGYVQVGGSGYGGAGIGGGYCASGGDYVQTGGYVDLGNAGYGGAAIGSGAGWCGSATSGGTVSVSGGTLSAASGYQGSAIGGGYNGGAAEVSVSGGSVNVYNNSGASTVAIGNGADYTGPVVGSLDVLAGGYVGIVTYGTGRAIGGLGTAPGIPVHVGPSGTLSLSSSDTMGGGDGQNWGSLTNEGTLTLDYGTTLTVPAGVVVHNSGRIDLGGPLTGAGTVDNTGRILPRYTYPYGGRVDNDGRGDGGLLVTSNNYRLTFATNGGPDAAPGDVVAFGPTLDTSERGLPGSTPPAGYAFKGWYTALTGGTKVDGSTDLRTLAGGDGPITVALYAHYNAVQQINFTSTPPTATIGSTYDVTAIGGASGQPVRLSLGTGTTNNACTLTGSTVTFRHAGTCDIAADQDGVPGSYDAAPTAHQSTPVAKLTQSITFGPLPDPLRPSDPVSFQLIATGGASGQPVVLTQPSAGACQLSGTTVTTIRVGTCTIYADQAGTADYSMAPRQTLVLTIDKVLQILAFTSAAPDAVVNGATYRPTAVNSSGATPVITVDPISAGACTMDAGVVSFVHRGQCVLAADRAGSSYYYPATTVTQSFTVAGVPQLLTFDHAMPTSTNVGDSTTAALEQQGASGNVPTYVVDGATTNAACTVDGDVVRFEHTGTCVLGALQSGDATYADGQVTRTITVGRAAQLVSFVTAAPAGASVGDEGYVPAAVGGGSANPVTFSVDGSSTQGACVLRDGAVRFEHVGTCVIAADQLGDGDHSDGVALQSFTIGRGPQSIDFAAPTHAVVGGSATLLATGGKSANPVTFTVDAGSDACRVDDDAVTYLHAGTCDIVAAQTGDADHLDAWPVTRSVSIAKAPQTITWTGTVPDAVVGGTPYVPSATGGLSGQAVTYSVDAATTNDACELVDGSVRFTHAGDCVLAADQAATSDFDAATSATRTITVSAQPFVFTALGATPTVGTDEALHVAAAAGDSFGFTVGDGTTNNACVVQDGRVAYRHVGTCAITATQQGGTWTAEQSVQVGKGAQTVTVTTPQPTGAIVGGSYTPAATASGGSVAVSATGTACFRDEGVVRFAHAGTCTVRFDQQGGTDWLSAQQVVQSFTVSVATPTVTVTTDPTRSVHGQAVHPSAHVTVDQGDVRIVGTVQFAVDGHDVGLPVAVVGGNATGAALSDTAGAPLVVGEHTITAAFVPTGTDLAPLTTTATHVVDVAATTTAVRTTSTGVVATVAPVAPGAGVASGSVTVTVGGKPFGTATLVDGVATLDKAVPAGRTQQVAAAYTGDSSFSGSSASLSRRDPSVTAHIAGSPTRTREGWYRGSVTVSFTCTTAGAELTAACPKPVVLDREGAGQSVTRTVTATDGGVDTVVVDSIDIDRSAPRAAVGGVRNHAVYRGSAPRVRCGGTDALSGIGACSAWTDKRYTADGIHVRYRVTVTDRAGNRDTVSGSYDVLTRWVDGARYRNGAFEIKAGRTYTLVVTDSSSRPVYYNAEVAPRRPTSRSRDFTAAGRDRWTLGISMDKAMRNHARWNAGIRVDGTVHTLPLRVTNAG